MKFCKAHRWNVIYVGLLDHCPHGALYRPVVKFVICMLIPDGLEIEIGSLHELLQEGKIPGMGNRLGRVAELFLERGCE